MARPAQAGEETAMGSQYSENRRSDEQLDAMLHETALWTINGRNGQSLGTALCLRQALDKAADFAASGATVAAVCRTLGDTIIIFEAQADRLRKLRGGRETPTLPSTGLRGLGSGVGQPGRRDNHERFDPAG
jgi:hypothetical protein